MALEEIFVNNDQTDGYREVDELKVEHESEEISPEARDARSND